MCVGGGVNVCIVTCMWVYMSGVCVYACVMVECVVERGMQSQSIDTCTKFTFKNSPM